MKNSFASREASGAETAILFLSTLSAVDYLNNKNLEFSIKRSSWASNAGVVVIGWKRNKSMSGVTKALLKQRFLQYSGWFA